MAVRRAVVSACLFGINCAYDGRHRCNQSLIRKLASADIEVFAVCPEFHLFGAPREPLEVSGGGGKDFLAGKAVLINKKGQIFSLEDLRTELDRLEKWLKFIKPHIAYLKEKSPFCGVRKIYDGSFSGMLVEGSGIMAVLLKKMGVELVGI